MHLVIAEISQVYSLMPFLSLNFAFEKILIWAGHGVTYYLEYVRQKINYIIDFTPMIARII
jgi:hypothetical protein